MVKTACNPGDPGSIPDLNPLEHIFKIFKSLYRICYNIPSALCFGFQGHEARGILAPQPGIKPAPLHWKVRS